MFIMQHYVLHVQYSDCFRSVVFILQYVFTINYTKVLEHDMFCEKINTHFTCT